MSQRYDGDERRAGTGLERHIQSAIGIVVIALLLWFGDAVDQLKEDTVKLQTQMEHVLSAMESAASMRVIEMDDRYRGRDAKRDFNQRDAILKTHEERLDRIERYVHGESNG